MEQTMKMRIGSALPNYKALMLKSLGFLMATADPNLQIIALSI